jgi:hypothetical protein
MAYFDSGFSRCGHCKWLKLHTAGAKEAAEKLGKSGKTG